MTCGVAKEYESPALPRLNAFPRGTPTGTVKLKLIAVSGAQYSGFTTDSSAVSWGSIDELYVNLTVSIIPLPAEVDR